MLLLEAMDNLASALQSAQTASAEEVSWDERQKLLEAVSQYCFRAAELLDQAEGSNPLAAETLRRGLPILDRHIKAMLQKIESESIKLREVTRHTPFESLG